MQRDEQVINQWSGSAPYWERHREVIREMFAPITQALVEDAQIHSGQTVLDVATGQGEPALDIAALMALGGRVVGIDPVAQMIEAARRAAETMGRGNVQFQVAFADQLPFPGHTFDAVVCRLGIMFFPSPVDAVREMLRVLKPDGKLALAVWHFAERNPFHSVVSSVLDRYIDSPPQPPEPPDAPGAFRFAAPGKLAGVLAEAGATGVAERLFSFPLRASLSVEDFWTARCGMSDSLRAKMAQLAPDQLAEMNHHAVAALREYSTDKGMNLPAEVLIVSGTAAR